MECPPIWWMSLGWRGVIMIHFYRKPHWGIAKLLYRPYRLTLIWKESGKNIYFLKKRSGKYHHFVTKSQGKSGNFFFKSLHTPWQELYLRGRSKIRNAGGWVGFVIFVTMRYEKYGGMGGLNVVRYVTQMKKLKMH